MAKSYYLNLNHSDDLETVIRKCNTNFQLFATQRQQSDVKNTKQQEDAESVTDEKIAQLEEDTAEAIGQAVDSMVQRIEAEANQRSGADLDLENAIDAIAQTIPDPPIDTAYLTFGTEDPANVYANTTWSQVGTLTVGNETLNVWKRTA